MCMRLRGVMSAAEAFLDALVVHFEKCDGRVPVPTTRTTARNRSAREAALAAAHHVWTPEREQTLRAALRTAPCASRAGRRVLDDEWQFHIARALAAAEPPSSGWAPTGDAVKQHYQKRLPLTDDTRAGLPDRAVHMIPSLHQNHFDVLLGAAQLPIPHHQNPPPGPPLPPCMRFLCSHQVSFFTARALSGPSASGATFAIVRPSAADDIAALTPWPHWNGQSSRGTGQCVRSR